MTSKASKNQSVKGIAYRWKNREFSSAQGAFYTVQEQFLDVFFRRVEGAAQVFDAATDSDFKRISRESGIIWVAPDGEIVAICGVRLLLVFTDWLGGDRELYEEPAQLAEEPAPVVSQAAKLENERQLARLVKASSARIDTPTPANVSIVEVSEEEAAAAREVWCVVERKFDDHLNYWSERKRVWRRILRNARSCLNYGVVSSLGAGVFSELSSPFSDDLRELSFEAIERAALQIEGAIERGEMPRWLCEESGLWPLDVPREPERNADALDKLDAGEEPRESAEGSSGPLRLSGEPAPVKAGGSRRKAAAPAATQQEMFAPASGPQIEMF